MENYLPLFPLNMVAFPGENVNLHIFEERYKDLINDCLEQKINFGIPAYINKRIEFGTEAKVDKIVKKYDDGRMDISTTALRVFKVMSFVNPVGGKTYAGGDVFFLENFEDGDYAARQELIQLITELYEVMNIVERVEVDEDITTFDIGHRIGLSQEKEYELIQIEKESDRQAYVIEHLKRTIPVLRETERTKEKIRMNGHFKYFDPLNF
jgi:hypothetical protein